MGAGRGSVIPRQQGVDIHERLEVETVGGFQRGAAGGTTGFENDAGEVGAAEPFAEEEADGAAIEAER